MTPRIRLFAGLFILLNIVGQALLQAHENIRAEGGGTLAVRPAKEAFRGQRTQRARQLAPTLRNMEAVQVALHARMAPAVVAVGCRAGHTPRRYYGSGVVISPSGLVLTSTTAVPPGGRERYVCFADGTLRPARVKARDAATESVVLAIRGSRGERWPFVPLGSSHDARIGERVHAAGNPHHTLERDGQVYWSAGTLSGRYFLQNDDRRSHYRGPVLETGAALNFGEDGGALLDERGRLLGLLSLGYARSRRLGTAVPVERIRKALPKIFCALPAAPIPARVEDRRTAMAGKMPALQAPISAHAEDLRKEPGGDGWGMIANTFRRNSRRAEAAVVRILAAPPVGETVSGVLIEPRGMVLTSAFNIKRAGARVSVVLPDGRRFPALVRGRRRDLDVALLEIQSMEPLFLPALSLEAHPALHPGRFITVLGAPPGPARGPEHSRAHGSGKRPAPTRTNGIVSALQRLAGLAVQVDARLNRGNAGGPVLDLQGRLVGLAAHIGSRQAWGQNSGVGFFTPSDRILDVLDELREDGHGKSPPRALLDARPDGGKRVRKGVPGTQGVLQAAAWRAGARARGPFPTARKPAHRRAALWRLPGRQAWPAEGAGILKTRAGAPGTAWFGNGYAPLGRWDAAHAATGTAARLYAKPENTLAGLASSGAAALSDSERTARRAERELVSLIERAVRAFVFVGGGSGVCISPDGLILTNRHVVVGARKSWMVRVYGAAAPGRARLVGCDPLGDVALLKIERTQGQPGLPFVRFADLSKARVGQIVLALGDPFKLGGREGAPSVSLGALCARHRYQGDPRDPSLRSFYADALQTDAAVNPGSSGGPLLDLDGRLLGLTGQIMPRFGGRTNTGIAYAVPADQLLRFLPLLKAAQGGAVHHGALPQGLRLDFKRKPRKDSAPLGVRITVEAHSPAARSGFRSGDRIRSVQGRPTRGPYQVLSAVQSWPEGVRLDFALRREKKRLRLRVKLPRFPEPPPPPLAPAPSSRRHVSRPAKLHSRSARR